MRPLLLSLLTLILAAAPSASADELESVLPPEGFLSPFRAEPPVAYDCSTLFEIIDGKAEQFFSYGFRALLAVDYVDTTDENRSLTLYVYDMGTLLNAFGIYSRHRHPRVTFLDLGAEGFESFSTLGAFKGRHFVYLEASDDSDDLLAANRALARYVVDRLRGTRFPPAELLVLPTKDRLAGSAQYVRGGLLGLEFLGDGLQAEYETAREDPTRVFVSFFDSPADARAAFDAFTRYARERSEDFRDEPGWPDRAFSARSPYWDVLLVTVKDRFVAGVVEIDAPEDGRALLTSTIDRINLYETMCR